MLAYERGNKKNLAYKSCRFFLTINLKDEQKKSNEKQQHLEKGPWDKKEIKKKTW